jgi:hypothetical protein
MLLGGGAQARKPGGKPEARPPGELRRAPRLRKAIPPSLEMQVGERESFQGIAHAGSTAAAVAVSASGGVLTILAVAEGRAEVLLLGDGRAGLGSTAPKAIQITVRRRDP